MDLTSIPQTKTCPRGPRRGNILSAASTLFRYEPETLSLAIPGPTHLRRYTMTRRMPTRLLFLLAALVLSACARASLAQQPPAPPIPDIRQLMHEVQQHQKEVEKERENDTYSSLITTQDIDGNGHVTKTETEEDENFFVNGHLIARMVKKNGQPLSSHEEQRETERVTKLVEKAQNTPQGQPIEGPSVSISRLLEIMDVRNPRRENYRGRPAIVFDFIGRKDAKTHGLVEDASKKLQGTLWIDEADRQVAHLEVSFNDNFHVAGGIFATVQKGSNFHFDQAPVGGGVWLPTGGEGSVQARLLLLKNLRQRYTERDYDFKRFSVETQESKDAKPAAATKP
jgi:hypothetical protein